MRSVFDLIAFDVGIGSMEDWLRAGVAYMASSKLHTLAETVEVAVGEDVMGMGTRVTRQSTPRDRAE